MTKQKWLAILTMVAPVVLMAVPGGLALAPLVPLIVTGIADAQKQPGATGAQKKAYVMALVGDALAVIEQTRPGVVDPLLMNAASSHAIDAILTTVNAVEKAHAAQPSVPALVP